MRLKRYAAPKIWKIARKEHVWTVRPKPGPHPANRSRPLSLILRDVLKFADTAKEAKKIIKSGKILVDKRVIKEPAFPVGLMDILEIPDAKKAFRVEISKKGLEFVEIPINTSEKICRIEGKTTVKGGLMQLNLHDGRNILVKDPKAYRVFDSVLIQLPDQKILAHYRLEEGATVRIISGKNAGLKGIVEEIKRRKTMLEKSTVKLRTELGMVETPLEYVMVEASKKEEKKKEKKKEVKKKGKGEKEEKKRVRKAKARKT